MLLLVLSVMVLVLLILLLVLLFLAKMLLTLLLLLLLFFTAVVVFYCWCCYCCCFLLLLLLLSLLLLFTAVGVGVVVCACGRHNLVFSPWSRDELQHSVGEQRQTHQVPCRIWGKQNEKHLYEKQALREAGLRMCCSTVCTLTRCYSKYAAFPRPAKLPRV